MNTLSEKKTILCSAKEYYKELIQDSEDLKSILKYSYYYVSKIIDSQYFLDILSCIFPEKRPHDYKRILDSIPHINIRYFLLILANEGYPLFKTIGYLIDACEVDYDEAKTVYDLYIEDDDFCLQSQLQNEFYGGITLEDYRRIELDFKKSIDVYRKQALYLTDSRKKLRFIYMYNEEDRENIISDLLYKAFEAHYSLYPTNESISYIQNYVKRSMTNIASTKARMYGTNKRRFVRDNNIDGEIYREKIVVNCIDDELRDIQNAQGHDSLSKTEFDIYISQKFNFLRNSPKGKIFLGALTGQRVKRFTEWLQKNKYIKRTQDADDFYEKVPQVEYTKAARLFSRLSEKKAQAILDRIEKEL